MRVKIPRVLRRKKDKGFDWQGIQKISAKGYFGLHVNNHLCTFWRNDLPFQVHYTVAFNEESPDINLHLTLNGDGQTKQQITVVRISKSLLSDILPDISARIFRSMFHPVDLKTLTSKASAFFINPQHPKQSGYLKFANRRLQNYLHNSCSRRGRRLKMPSDFRKNLENLFAYPHGYWLDKLKLTEEVSADCDTAFVMSDEREITMLKKINGDWYEVCRLSEAKLLEEILGVKLANMMQNSLKRALVILRNGTVDGYKHRTVRIIKVA